MSDLVEIVSREIGHTFASLVSGNNQPVMSGDPRDRMLPHIRRQFDDACNEAALAAIRAIEGDGKKIVGKTCTQNQWEAIGAFVPDPTAFCFHELWEIAFNAADTFGGGE